MLGAASAPASLLPTAAASQAALHRQLAARQLLPLQARAASGAISGTAAVPLRMVAATEAPHELLDDVGVVQLNDAALRDATASVAPDAQLVATYSDGVPAVAYLDAAPPIEDSSSSSSSDSSSSNGSNSGSDSGRTPHAGRMVAVNMWLPSSDEARGGWDAATNGDYLIRNAVMFAARGAGEGTQQCCSPHSAGMLDCANHNMPPLLRLGCIEDDMLSNHLRQRGGLLLRFGRSHRPLMSHHSMHGSGHTGQATQSLIGVAIIGGVVVAIGLLLRYRAAASGSASRPHDQ